MDISILSKITRELKEMNNQTIKLILWNDTQKDLTVSLRNGKAFNYPIGDMTYYKDAAYEINNIASDLSEIKYESY